MQAYEGVDTQIHIFLTLALAGGDWSVSRHGIRVVVGLISYAFTRTVTELASQNRPLNLHRRSHGCYEHSVTLYDGFIIKK
jgi:hypothetical protein